MRCLVTGHAPFFSSACHLGLRRSVRCPGLSPSKANRPLKAPRWPHLRRGFSLARALNPGWGTSSNSAKAGARILANIFVRLCIAQDSGGRALLLPLPFVRRSVSYRGAVAPRVAGCPPGRFLLNFGPLASRRRSFFTVEELCCSAAVVTQINAGGIHVGPASG